MILSFHEVFKEPFKCRKKYFVVSESLWTFQLRNLIATFFRATQGFFSNWVWTCRQHVMWWAVLCRPQVLRCKPQYFVSPPFFPLSALFMYVGEACWVWLMSPSCGLSTHPNFFLHSSFGPKQWWNCWLVSVSFHGSHRQDMAITKRAWRMENTIWTMQFKYHKPLFFHLRKISHAAFCCFLLWPKTT